MKNLREIIIITLLTAILLVVSIQLFMAWPRAEVVSDEPLVQRVIDEEAGVVCWVAQSGGLYCLPLGTQEETTVSP